VSQDTQPTQENPPAVVSSAPTANTVGQAVREAKGRKTAAKNKSRTTKSGGVRYIPGQSCIQLKVEHQFERRTAKSGKQYDVCKKCGSSKMVRDADTSTKKRPAGSSGSKPERPANTDIRCMNCAHYNPYGTEFCKSCGADMRPLREVCLSLFTKNSDGKIGRCDRSYGHQGKHSVGGVE